MASRLDPHRFDDGLLERGVVAGMRAHDMAQIDRVFLANAAENASARSVLQALMDFGRTLAVSVVAEGVENRHELETLLGPSCELAQGFLFSRPMPSDSVPSYLASDLKSSV